MSHILDMLSFRVAEGGDFNYIFATWFNSYKRDAPFGREGAAAAIDQAKGLDSHYLVAEIKGTDGLLVGWAVAHKPVLGYVYVKREWRGKGVARELVDRLDIPKDPLLCFNWTRYAKWIAKKHPLRKL